MWTSVWTIPWAWVTENTSKYLLENLEWTVKTDRIKFCLNELHTSHSRHKRILTSVSWSNFFFFAFFWNTNIKFPYNTSISLNENIWGNLYLSVFTQFTLTRVRNVLFPKMRVLILMHDRAKKCIKYAICWLQNAYSLLIILLDIYIT